MKDSQKKDINKPGLEEALHPEIGNEAAWANDEHTLSMSLADSLKSLDKYILEEETLLKTVHHWKTEFNGESIGQEFTNREQQEIEPQIESKQVIRVTQKNKESEDLVAPVYWEENESGPDMNQLDSTSKKEKKKKEKDPLKASKRIRKLADKVKKEEEKRVEGNAKVAATSLETSLSPFTNWLKGLSGSEYVHPYDDDFAFNQGSGHAGESISETFADLLAAQGYKEQAIAMYARLMEKFPEKSRFFAAKIEALQ